jgi:hypothetical protein
MGFPLGAGIDNGGDGAKVINTLVAKQMSGANCSGSAFSAQSTNNLDDDGSCSGGFTQSSSLLLGSLGNHGGSTQTMPLLPDSPAVDAGDPEACAARDQRGVSRVGPCDIGAFESRGFTLTKTAGDWQAGPVNKPFPIPLAVDVASLYDEPVDGGQVVFAGPSSGASTEPAVYTATISGGVVSQTVTANGVSGSYSVAARARPGGTANFSLTNNPCSPGTVTVVNAGNSGAGSLRQAIADVCPGGLVNFDGGYFNVARTVFLSAQLDVIKSVTIDGSGVVTPTISGSGVTRVFSIDSGTDVTLSRLRVAGGYAGGGGGGIYNSGTLTITNASVENSSASWNGGGIYNAGTLAVTSSSVSGNSAPAVNARGGGIYNSGALTTTDSRLTGNSAYWQGGAVYNVGALTAVNSTFAGHAQYGGGVHNSGVMTLANSRFSGGNATNAGGGINNEGTVTDIGSAFSGNSAGGGGGIRNTGVLTATNNTFSANTANSGGGINNDGRMILAGVTFTSNIGSAVANSGALSIADSAFISNTGMMGGGINNYGTLAVTESTFSGNTAPSLGSCGGGIWNNGSLTVTDSAFSGNAASDGDGGGICNTVAGSVGDLHTGTLTVTNTTFAGNSAKWGGGAISNGGVMTLTGATVAGNSTTSYGGGIGNTGVLTATNSTFSANTANSGGGINNDGKTILVGVTFTSNIGSAVANSGALSIADSAFISNTGMMGGGIYNTGLLAVTGSIVSGSSATGSYGSGGGISNNGGTLTVTSSTVSGNSATYAGGVHNDTGAVTLADSRIEGNTGGGISNYFGTLAVINSTVFSNTTPGSYTAGAGIFNQGILTVTNSTIAGNTADQNGGILNAGTLSVTNSTFYGNSGGGIYNQGGVASAKNTLIAKGSTGSNCAGSPFAAGSSSNLDDDGSCSGGFARSSTLLLGTLGNYGGGTQTVPLLPNSAAIDAGDPASCPSQDQRGVSRVGPCDVGAYESRGFVLTKTSGDDQTTFVNIAFAIPLALSVTSSNSEPVNGGQLIFAAPSSGASTSPTIYSATIASGSVSRGVTANSVVGSYNIIASARGAVSATFSLTNTACSPKAVTVANANDSGPGSLRQAIADVCAAGTITFDPTYFAVARTIALAAPLVVDKSLSIDGAGVVAPTISGGNATRVFVVSSGGVTLNRLSISNGSSGEGGGGILNAGALTVTNSTVVSNTTSGFSHGGGIHNDGALAIANSTLSGNTALGDWGGGIYNEGTLTLTNVTFASNGAISGGGIYNASGLATVKNTLVAKGSTGPNCAGSPFAAGSSNNLDDDGSCTGGFTRSFNLPLGALGSYGGGTWTIPLLPNSPAIDAGNDSVCPATDQRGIARLQGAHCDIGAFESRAFTLTITGGNGQTTSIDSAFAIPLSLDVTSPNGDPVDGGQVVFMAPSSGASTRPAVYTATISGGVVSQSVTANSAIGSYNVIASAGGAVSTSFSLNNGECSPKAVTIANANDSGPGSLRQAIADVCAAGTITFDPAYFAVPRTITLSAQIDITKSLTIDGTGVISPTISGNNATRVFNITAGSSVTLHQLIISGGNAAGSGGGIYNAGTLTVTNSSLSGNSASSGDGGGIYNSSWLAVTNVTVAGNKASYGGGIHNDGTLTVTKSTFSGNTAISGVAGGIYNSGTLTITNSTFAGNSADWGGGIYSDGMLTVMSSTFYGNSAGGGGGGIYNNGVTATVRNTAIGKGTTGSNCLGSSFAAGSAGNLDDDGSCSGGFTRSSTLLFGALGSYGGSTLTIPLLPNSPAIDAGDQASCPEQDQRGVSRVGLCDIGAFESRGFSLADQTGTPQDTVTNAPFPQPLHLHVTSGFGEPVDGGQVIFAAPASGASIIVTPITVTISGGAVAQAVTANGTPGGPFSVLATMRGVSSSMAFALTNSAFRLYLPLIVRGSSM